MIATDNIKQIKVFRLMLSPTRNVDKSAKIIIPTANPIILPGQS